MASTGKHRQAVASAKGGPPKQADYGDVVEYLSAYDAWERGETPKAGRRHGILVALEDGGGWAERTHANAVEVESWGTGQGARARKEYESAQVQFCHALRGYVDRWLDSALRPDGSETPSGRNILSDMSRFQQFLDDHATAYLDPWGKITFGLECYGPETKRYQGPTDQALRDAVVYFLEFLRSEDRSRLAKCRRCGKYFIKGEHGRRFRVRYLRGIHCGECRNKATAVLSRGKSLKEFEDTWLSLAVRAYHKGRAKHREENGLKRFILMEVNDRLDPKGPRLKLNRLTMWWSRIVRNAGADEFSAMKKVGGAEEISQKSNESNHRKAKERAQKA